MRTLLNYIWRFWLLLLVTVFTLLFGLPVYLLSFNKKYYRACYALIRVWCILIFYGMGFRYKLTNLSGEKMNPNQQYVVIANHTSIMDIMLMCVLLPNHPVCFVGKKELVKIPIFGQIYKRVCVMVDRNSARSRAEVYVRSAEKMREGNNIVIFPEGGVSDDPNAILDPFKDGAFILSSKHNFPIAVFTFVGLRQMFPFDNGKGYPGKVQVYFNGILPPEKTSQEMREHAHAMIKDTIVKNLTTSK